MWLRPFLSPSVYSLLTFKTDNINAWRYVNYTALASIGFSLPSYFNEQLPFLSTSVSQTFVSHFQIAHGYLAKATRAKWKRLAKHSKS